MGCVQSRKLKVAEARIKSQQRWILRQWAEKLKKHKEEKYMAEQARIPLTWDEEWHDESYLDEDGCTAWPDREHKSVINQLAQVQEQLVQTQEQLVQAQELAQVHEQKDEQKGQLAQVQDQLLQTQDQLVLARTAWPDHEQEAEQGEAVEDGVPELVDCVPDRPSEGRYAALLQRLQENPSYEELMAQVARQCTPVPYRQVEYIHDVEVFHEDYEVKEFNTSDIQLVEELVDIFQRQY
jgi:hypothetical protein